MRILHAQAANASPRAFLSLVLLLIASRTTLAGQAEAIAWQTDFARAQALSKSSDLPLWIQFTAPWCHYCRVMESESFSRPEIIRSAVGNCIAVKVRPDHREDLAAYYGVTTIPATVLIHPNGRVLARRSGYAAPARFHAFLEQSLIRPNAVVRAVKNRENAAEITPVAFAGDCPVTLVRDGRIEAGQPSLSLVHAGRRYFFADAEHLRAFQEEPQAYLPAADGHCVVAKHDEDRVVDGDPRWAVHYRGRLYYCSDPASRDRFAKNPDRYANTDVAGRGDCLHCRIEAGRKVRGEPRFSTTHEGRRYFFAGPDHLSAFRAAPDKYVR